MKAGWTSVQLIVEKEKWKRLKKIATEKEMFIRGLMREILNEYLEREEKKK